MESLVAAGQPEPRLNRPTPKTKAPGAEPAPGAKGTEPTRPPAPGVDLSTVLYVVYICLYRHMELEKFM